MKKLLLSAVGILLTVAIFAGCSTPPATSVFNAENLAADAATAATHAFNVYYAEQPATGQTNLNIARDSIYTADEHLSSALKTLEAIRSEYAANTSATNAASMQIALQAVGDQSSNIVSLVQSVMGK